MSSYGDPEPEHRNAVANVDKARQRALNAVSEVRKANIITPHPNLAPPEVEIEHNNTPTLPVACSQAVVDYLLQLRPYRHNSTNWSINFGKITLPETIDVGSSRRGGSGNRYSLQGDRVFPLTDASEVIDAVNTTVVYQYTDLSSDWGDDSDSKRYKVVFAPGTLLKIVEVADEIAAEMDMLADEKPPDHSAAGGDAV